MYKTYSDYYSDFKKRSSDPEFHLEFIESSVVSSLYRDSNFLKAKAKYLEPSFSGDVYNIEKIESLLHLLEDNSSDELFKKVSERIGIGMVGSFMLNENSDDSESQQGFGHDMIVEAIHILKNMKKICINNDGELSFAEHSRMFNAIMSKVYPEHLDDFIPFQFDRNSSNIGIFGYSIDTDGKKKATEVEAFNVVADLVTNAFDNFVSEGRNNPPEFITFSSTGNTGCVCADPNIFNATKYNFQYDSVVKYEMYNLMKKMSYNQVIDTIRASFMFVGSRLQMYPKQKRQKRYSIEPFDIKSKKFSKEIFKLYHGYKTKASLQVNLFNGFSHRPVAGVGSMAQYHGSHDLQLFYKGLDGHFKRWMKFTPDELGKLINIAYKKRQKIPISYDVANSEFRVDSQAILDKFFKVFQNGIYSDIADAIYSDIPIAGFYKHPLMEILLYMMKSGKPNRFISGWIFTGLGNAWYYVIFMILCYTIYLGVKQGIISQANAWKITGNQIYDIFYKNIEEYEFFNQGDDMTFMIFKDDIDLFDEIVNANPYILIEREDRAVMSGMEINFVKDEDIFVLNTKAATILMKSSEKFEGRSSYHGLRRGVFTSLKGKIDLVNLRPVFGEFDGGISMTKVYARTLGIDFHSVNSINLLALLEIYLLEDDGYRNAMSKAIIIDKIVQHFKLNSATDIGWKITASDMEASGIEGFGELFVTLLFEEGYNSPFFNKR